MFRNFFAGVLQNENPLHSLLKCIHFYDILEKGV